MDLSDPTGLMAAVLLGGVGMGLFIHGKKSSNFKTLGVGLVLMVAPNFITSLWMDLALVAGCAAALVLLPSGGD